MKQTIKLYPKFSYVDNEYLFVTIRRCPEYASLGIHKTTAYEIVFGQKPNNLSGICKKDEDLEESELQYLFPELADKMYVTTKTEIKENSTSTSE